MIKLLLSLSFLLSPVLHSATLNDLLSKYCYECHGIKEVEAEIDFQKLNDFKSLYLNYDVVKDSLINIEAREMPPKEVQISIDDRRELISHLKAVLAKIQSFASDDPGPSPARRLTAIEYDNSVEAVTGLQLNLSKNFPANGAGGEGFSNDYSVLTVTSLQFEKYFEAAQEISSYLSFELKGGFRFNTAKTELPPEKEFIKSQEIISASQKLKPIISEFTLKAFRFPQSHNEIERMTSDFLEDTNRFGLQMAARLFVIRCFVSAKFLFRFEEKAPNRRRVNGYELASRLSYFIWSTPPDLELRALAESGELLKKEVIIYEVERMLKDRRSRALADGFAAEWLKFGEIKSSESPDTEKFPFYNSQLADDMYEESALYFNYILKEDRSVFEIIDSDYTFINKKLADIYELQHYGSGFKKVSVKDKQRGGMLTQSSILTITSLPKRTSPIYRGNWVISTILGTPTPPPPANAGMLPEEPNKNKNESLKDLLSDHRNSPGCKGCHVKIDPPGFALENYDAIGRWREIYENGQPIDNVGEIDSRQVTGPEDLKKYLLQKRRLFLKNISQKMFGYALGRKIRANDLFSINQMVINLENHDNKIFALIATIALSNQFQFKRKDL
ncbi:MAG: DUF1592 domain-containing protein [Lentisphaeraceae bacterium]|nr:DUF1592 domain-containing protein [Lentisphaeraceae bacterium]